MDGREHGGIITAEGRRVPQARAVYTRVFTAANSGNRSCLGETVGMLMRCVMLYANTPLNIYTMMKRCW